MNGEIKFDDTKPEIVLYTTSQQDKEIINLCKRAYATNSRAVLIIPAKNAEYSPQILEGFKLLGDDFLIFEINMGMNANLRKRAQKYIEYNKYSTLYVPH